jgi:hypothetical protein
MSTSHQGMIATHLVNLTPHPVDILTAGGRLRLPAASVPARLEGSTESVGSVTVGDHVIPLVSQHFIRVVGLPEESSGTLLVVSQMVLDYVKERRDLVAPADLVRDAQGAVAGCRAFVVRSE